MSQFPPQPARILIAACLLVVVLVSQVAAQDTEIGVRIAPGASFPLGDAEGIYAMGGQAMLSGTLSPRFAPDLLGSVGGGYAISTLSIDTTLSILSGGASLALRIPLQDNVRLEASGGGGGYYGLLNSGMGPRNGGGLLHGGAGLFFDLTPGISLGLVAEYRNYLGLGQFLSVSLSNAYSFRPGMPGTVAPTVAPTDTPTVAPSIMQPITSAPRPLVESARAPILQIQEPEFEEVFPVFFKYYDEHPIGHAGIRNVSEQTVRNIHMNLFVNQYMDNPTTCTVPIALEPGESADVDINGFFNDRVMTIEESTKVSAEIKLVYSADGQEYQETYTQVIRLHDRNTMTWDDFSKPAAYVTSKDGAVLSLRGQISRVLRDARPTAVHPNLQTAIALHAALNLHGISYTPDPSSPYRQGDELALDYIQFPRQTLAYKAGDCDDLSILYCAMLESFSIPTAMVLVPGHIFIALDLDMSVQVARSQFPRVEDLIFRGGNAWLPLEVTSISDGFMSAWQAGARQWRESTAREQEAFVEIAGARQTYEPVGLPASDQSMALPETTEILTAYNRELTTFVDQTIYSQVAEIQMRINERGRVPRLVNRLAVLYARYGLYERARAELLRLRTEYPDYLPAVANLGNIEYQEGDLQAAARYYDQALDLEPDDPNVLLSLARVNHQMENYGTATRSYERVKELDPSLAGRFAYLGMQGDDAARAAEAGGLSATMLWIEDEEVE